jgi:TonB family protein
MKEDHTMKRFFLAVALTMCAGTCDAQMAPSPPRATQTQPMGVPLSVTPPKRLPSPPAAECSKQVDPSIWQNVSNAGPTALSFKIATDGTVHDVTVLTSSGVKDVDDIATGCLATWRFSPATQDGKPVEVPAKAKIDLRTQGPK